MRRCLQNPIWGCFCKLQEALSNRQLDNYIWSLEESLKVEINVVETSAYQLWFKSWESTGQEGKWPQDWSLQNSKKYTSDWRGNIQTQSSQKEGHQEILKCLPESSGQWRTHKKDPVKQGQRWDDTVWDSQVTWVRMVLVDHLGMGTEGWERKETRCRYSDISHWLTNAIYCGRAKRKLHLFTM